MQDNQLKAINWIKSGMEYASGVDLLVELTRKQKFYNLFTGKDKSLPDKLAYEICKAAVLANHVTWKAFIREVQSVNCRDAQRASGCESETVNQPTDFPDAKMPELIPNNANKQIISEPHSVRMTETIETIVTTETTETIFSKPLAEYPPIIRRIIHEYAALFQERSKLHTVMVDMPESNAESVCAKRAELFDLIKSISARLEILYSAKREFDEKAIIPEESSVFPSVGKEEAEPNIFSLDEATLKKQKKTCRAATQKIRRCSITSRKSARK